MMEKVLPSFRIFNRNILLMEWEAIIDQNQMHLIEEFAASLKNNGSYSFRDIVPAFHSITVYFKDEIHDPAELFDELKASFLKTSNSTIIPHKVWKIPVVYGGTHGPDFDFVCQTLRLDKDEVIERHTAPLYEVYFIGFLPGFPYLGGLDPALNIGRKSVPAISTNAGSVGIGGSQTGIYTVNSPGGWHVIGRTPFPLFDIKRSIPNVIQSRDQIKFFAIQESEMEDYKQQLENEIV